MFTLCCRTSVAGSDCAPGMWQFPCVDLGPIFCFIFKFPLPLPTQFTHIPHTPSPSPFSPPRTPLQMLCFLYFVTRKLPSLPPSLPHPMPWIGTAPGGVRSRKQSAIGKHFSTCCPEFAANKVTCGRSASASLAPETHPRPDVEETTTILKRNTSHLQHVENQEKYPLQTVV